jgi:RHS repeat-associated protein
MCDGVIAWRWDSDPFGTDSADKDPDNDTNGFVYHLRFPGQYFDEETGLHYNYFRDYDPVTGRYVENDPTGVDGGLNTYAYANLDPLKYADPTGEIVDTLVDAGFIIYDLYRIVRVNVIDQCDNLAENSAALGADVAGLLTPFATGLGVVVRGGLKVINEFSR